MGAQQRSRWWRLSPNAAPTGARGFVGSHADAFVEGSFVLALTVRVFFVYLAGSNFPLNDGGLFLTMAEAVRDNSYRLPGSVSYSGADIPFVYSPLGPYAAAIFADLTPFSDLDAFRLLPLAGATFACWACWRLGQTTLGSTAAAALALLAFALMPRAYAWLLMGGGLPRGFALGFALLAFREGYLLITGAHDVRRERWRSVVKVGVLAGLTALTHLETAAFLAVSCLLLVAFRPRSVAWLAPAVGLGLLVVTPWAVVVVSRHGLDPFLAALDFGGPAVDGGGLSFDRLLAASRDPVATGEPYFPIIGALGLAGAVVSVARGNWFLPAWWLLTAFVAMRAWPTFAAGPVALLVGYALAETAWPAVRDKWCEGGLAQKVIVATTSVAALALVTSNALSTNRGENWYLKSLGEADRTAMAWTERATPRDARFAVVPVRAWFADYVSEWFPAVTNRASVATPQGFEWIEGEFARRELLHRALWDCADEGYVCVMQAMGQTTYTHVFVSAECCQPLKESLRDSRRFTVVYDNGALIAERVIE